MKKLLLSVAVLATVFTSCEKEAEVVGKGSLELTPIVNNSETIGKKGAVNRGDIPVYVKAINVKTLANAGETNTHFDLVDEGGANRFVINNVPLGQNTITATSEAALEGKRFIYSISTDYMHEYVGSTRDEIGGLLAAQFEDQFNMGNSDLGLPIYAEYSGTTSVNLSDETPANVNVDMTTENGSMLVSFGPENAFDLENYKIKIAVKSSIKEYTQQTIWLNSTKNIAILYWTGKEVVGGESVHVVMTWYEADSTVELDSKEFDVTVDAGVAKYTKVLIGREAFVKSEQGLSFDFTPIEDKDDVVYIGDEVIKMSDVVEADWNLSTGAFIAQDGTFTYAWKRNGSGASNLAAAVYNSADWNQNLKDQAYLSVVQNLSAKGWDMLVYDKHTDANVFNAWKAKYVVDGHFDATTALRKTWYYYDAYGQVIGMYRAKEAGMMSQAEYDGYIADATARIAELGGLTEEYQNAFFKLIAEATGEDLGVTPAATVDVTGFDAQNLGFAAVAYGREGTNLYGTELQVLLIKGAKYAETSLSSVDAINGYYSLN